MHRLCWLPTTMLIWIVGWSGSVLRGQETTIESRESTPAENQFAETLDRVTKALQSTPAYRVDATTRWTQRYRDESVSGTVVARVQRATNRLRLEIQPADHEHPQLVVASDGTKLVQWLQAENLYTEFGTEEPWEELQNCSVTQDALQFCGIGFLLQPSMRAAVESQILRLVDLGTAEIEDQPCRHFDLVLQDGRQVDVWFQGDEPGLPLKIVTHREVSLPDGLRSTLTLETRLVWQLDSELEPAAFEVQLPDGARQVEDLRDGLLTGDSAALVGQPLPEFKLLPLDSKAAPAPQAAPLKIDGITVLYFWASWAAPSIEEIPRLNRFVDDMQQLGVRVVAVNVAEKPEFVTEFVRRNDFRGDVRIDPDGQAAHQLRLTHLPTVVLVDQKGSIVAVREKSNREFEPKLRGAIQTLLKSGEKR